MTNTHVAPLEGAQTISMLINGERVQASNGAFPCWQRKHVDTVESD
jgi:hypothetical protein